jgi:fumarate reductase subunit C
VSLRTRQLLILGTWTLLVVAYVWTFHIEPPHDDEYGKWLFLSLLFTGLPWACCSVTLALVVFSLDTPPRTRRRWITVIWAFVVVCLAWVDLHPLLHASLLPEPTWYKPVWRVTGAVGDFAFRRLFPALFILAAFLWIEKKLVRRGLFTQSGG